MRKFLHLFFREFLEYILAYASQVYSPVLCLELQQLLPELLLHGCPELLDPVELRRVRHIQYLLYLVFLQNLFDKVCSVDCGVIPKQTHSPALVLLSQLFQEVSDVYCLEVALLFVGPEGFTGVERYRSNNCDLFIVAWNMFDSNISSSPRPRIFFPILCAK